MLEHHPWGRLPEKVLRCHSYLQDKLRMHITAVSMEVVITYCSMLCRLATTGQATDMCICRLDLCLPERVLCDNMLNEQAC